MAASTTFVRTAQVMPDALEEAAIFGPMAADTPQATNPGLLHHLLQPVESGFEAERAAAAVAAQSRQLREPEVPCGVKWLVCDGSLRGAMADRMSRLLLGQPIAVGNGARVRLQPHHRLIWECTELASASPALVTSVGLCTITEPLPCAMKLLALAMDDILAACPQLDQVRIRSDT